jgi:hypothetical protein
MSLTNSKLSVETIVPEGNVTYYVTLQAANTGKSAVDYVSPLLTYNTGLEKFFINNVAVPTVSNVVSTGSSVSSPIPPNDPKVGDLWYDTVSDIQFEYVNDGFYNQWVDITGPTMSIGGPVSTNNFTYIPLTATANSISNITAVVGDSVTFNTYIGVSGGYPSAYTFFVNSGTLPTGLTLNSSTGVVSGTITLAVPAGNITTLPVTFAVRDAAGYVASAKVTVTFTVYAATYIVSYLMVGGGGGVMPYGSNAATGGGGGGGVLFGCTTLTRRTAYPVVVAAGGSIAQAAGFTAAPDSTFNGLTAFGGGAGTWLRSPGGSGGGNGVAGPAPLGAGFGWPGIAGSTQQGFPGGLFANSGPPAGGGGGGGGAGAAGGTATPVLAGAGGAGYTWPITGQTYGGGGGGGAYGTTTGGNGGPGGGGQGVKGPGSAPISNNQGTNGLGGGAGGGGTNAVSNPSFLAPGAAGGSGTIILIVPGSNFGLFGSSFPGAGIVCAPPAAPGSKLVQYSAANPATPTSFTLIA